MSNLGKMQRRTIIRIAKKLATKHAQEFQKSKNPDSLSARHSKQKDEKMTFIYNEYELVDQHTINDEKALFNEKYEHYRNKKIQNTDMTYFNYVDVKTGKKHKLSGDALLIAVREDRVITRNAYKARKLVDAETGKVSTLEGDALQQARDNGTVITRNAYKTRKLVDAETGEVSTLEGDALQQARDNGTVITRGAYKARKLVDAETGEVSTLEGDALQQARDNGTVISRGAYYKRKLVDAETGEVTTLEGEALRQAKEQNKVIKRGKFYASKTDGRSVQTTGNSAMALSHASDAILLTSFHRLANQTTTNLSQQNTSTTIDLTNKRKRSASLDKESGSVDTEITEKRQKTLAMGSNIHRLFQNSTSSQQLVDNDIVDMEIEPTL